MAAVGGGASMPHILLIKSGAGGATEQLCVSCCTSLLPSSSNFVSSKPAVHSRSSSSISSYLGMGVGRCAGFKVEAFKHLSQVTSSSEYHNNVSGGRIGGGLCVQSALGSTLSSQFVDTLPNQKSLGTPVIPGGQKGSRRRNFQVHAKSPDDDGPPPEYSSDTKIRSEVISPFRSVRMFFYLAFIASGTIGSLITLTRFAAALSNAPNAQPISDIFKDLGIDLAAVTIFALLYRSDARARDVSLAKLSREEILSTLRVELANKRVVTLQQLRGIARIVIISGSTDYIKEAFKRGEPLKEDLLERGVLVVPYSLDGPLSSSELIASTPKQGEGSVAVQEQPKVTATERWIATPIYTSEWSRWLNAQKKLANVSKDQPVYISLRLDGRVRGSGVGYPPWQRFAVQLPPMAGIWKGPLDGMDGRI